MSDPATLDVRGMLCPLPVIHTQNRVSQLKPGERLAIVCTDPGAIIDIPVWCRVNGHKVLETDEQTSEINILIEVGEQES